MLSYTYCFLELNRTYYVYSDSLENAKTKYKEETGNDPDSVKVTRVEAGNSHKPDFNNPFA